MLVGTVIFGIYPAGNDFDLQENQGVRVIPKSGLSQNFSYRFRFKAAKCSLQYENHIRSNANQCKWPPREGQKQTHFVVFVSFSDHLINQYWSSVVLEGYKVFKISISAIFRNVSPIKQSIYVSKGMCFKRLQNLDFVFPTQLFGLTQCGQDASAPYTRILLENFQVRVIPRSG